MHYLKLLIQTCLLLIFLQGGSSWAMPVISELVASNGESLEDEDGDSPDWIEVFNSSETETYDLAGWRLSDDPTNTSKWVFPSVSLPPGGYLVVFASDKNRALAGQPLHTNFKLSSTGEYLVLVSPQGVKSTEFAPYPALERDVSYGLVQGLSETEFVVKEGSPAKMLIPAADEAAWQSADYDDAWWTSVVSGIGYERSSSNSYDPYISTDIESGFYNQNSTVYLRYAFEVADISRLQQVLFKAKFDDAFVAYLNGQEVARDNFAGTPVWNSIADSSQEADLGQFREWDVSQAIPALKTGSNVLAIHAINRFTTSSDFLMLPELNLVSEREVEVGGYDFFSEPTPGGINDALAGALSAEVQISEPSGVKRGPVSVSLSCAVVEAEIRYTLDGSEPDAQSPLYQAALSIDRPSRLRARAFEPDKVPGRIAVADYAFLDASLLDYASEVPVVVMDNFGAGAYPNKGRTNDGHDVMQVPRQANVMGIFEPDAQARPFSLPASLQARAGCRVRGSSSSTFSRKPLSVEFWDGKDKDLALSPFGMEAEADWVLYAPNPSYDRSLIHNPVSFEFARMIQALAPQSQVVVVFQNTDGGKVGPGDLAGVYIWMEKIERKRMGLDFAKMSDDGSQGGWMLNVDRMEAIPVGWPADTIQPNFHAAGPDGILSIPDDEQNSGGFQSVDDISTFYHSYLNFASPDAYGIRSAQRSVIQNEVRAMDRAMWSASSTDPQTGWAAHLDAASWARFYAVQNFAKNNDAIVLSTYLWRRSPGELIQMGPVWDFDRAYTQNGSATSSPLAYAERDWYLGLFRDPEFRQIHQDVWQTARAGQASDTALEAAVDRFSAGLLPDQIAASGLDYASWQSQLAQMRRWVVDRARYIDSQFEALPEVTPASGSFEGEVWVSMQANQGGELYYTTDGTDPRLRGGGVSSAASLYTSPLRITSRTRLIVRVKDGDRWSGPVERNYFQLSELPKLVVSELHYHPAVPNAIEEAQGFEKDGDFEFIEVLNVGSQVADLRSLQLAGGISFDFETGAVASLSPGQRVLVARNQAGFEARYGLGLPVAGVYEGALDNAGELVRLRDKWLDIDLQAFTYSDQAPWPEEADGDGYSLVLMQPETLPEHQLAPNWRGSRLIHGTPGGNDALGVFTGEAQADLDGDGLSALLEYVLGSSDQDAHAGAELVQQVWVLAGDGLNYPGLQFEYEVGADDWSIQPQLSTDLEQWELASHQLIRTAIQRLPDGRQRVIYRSPLPVEQGPQFFRLKVDPR